MRRRERREGGRKKERKGRGERKERELFSKKYK